MHSSEPQGAILSESTWPMHDHQSGRRNLKPSTLFVLPPRTSLFPLEPINLGFWRAEALSSYLARLAEAHCTSVSSLIEEVAPGTLTRMNIVGAEKFRGTVYSNPSLLSTGGKDAQRLLDGLIARTGQKNLANTTAAMFFDVVANRNGRRRKRAWCPACLAEQLSGKRYAYLVWQIEFVECCQEHKIRLTTTCPHCFRGDQSILSPLHSPGKCLHCKKELHDDSRDQHKCNQEQLTIAAEVGSVIAKISGGEVLRSASLQNKFFNEIIDVVAAGNAASFAQMIGCTRASIHGWRTTEVRPSFTYWLRTSRVLGVSLYDVLSECNCDWNVKAGVRMEVMSGVQPRYAPDLKMKVRVALEQCLQGIEQAGVEMSVPTVARLYGVKVYSIYDWHPDLCSEIAKQNAQLRKQLAEGRLESAKSAMSKVFARRLERGESIARRHVLREIREQGETAWYGCWHPLNVHYLELRRELAELSKKVP